MVKRSSDAYVGLTDLPRYVISTRDKGRVYYYFRRRRFPYVRLPGAPGEPMFTSVYVAALEATNDGGDLTALRANMPKRRPTQPPSPHGEAMWAWAQRRLTMAQAVHVAKVFGVDIEDIVRGRQIIIEVTVNQSKK